MWHVKQLFDEILSRQSIYERGKYFYNVFSNYFLRIIGRTNVIVLCMYTYIGKLSHAYVYLVMAHKMAIVDALAIFLVWTKESEPNACMHCMLIGMLNHGYIN